MADENVVLVTFDEESRAYQAATVLKEASAQGRIDLHAVAVVQRAEDGTLRVKEGDADDFPVGTWTGGSRWHDRRDLGADVGHAWRAAGAPAWRRGRGAFGLPDRPGRRRRGSRKRAGHDGQSHRAGQDGPHRTCYGAGGRGGRHRDGAPRR